MRGIRVGAAAGLALAAASVLAGCEPYGTAYPENTAKVTVEVEADGSALVKVFLDASEHSDEELLAAGAAAKSVLGPPALIDDVHIEGNGGGYPYVVVIYEGAFVPGDDPVVSFDTTGLITHLLGQGLDSVQVSWRQTIVASTPDWQPSSESDRPGVGFWGTVGDPADSPRGTVTLHPDPRPVRALSSVLGSLVAFGTVIAAIVALMLRKHRAAWILAASSMAVGLSALALDGYVETGELVAAGGPAWPYALFSPAAALALGTLFFGAPIVIGLALGGVPRPYLRSDPPPGWPGTPEGWLPFAGWYPSPHWPPAPNDWEFLTPVRKSKAQGNTDRHARAAARAWVNWYRGLQR